MAGVNAGPSSRLIEGSLPLSSPALSPLDAFGPPRLAGMRIGVVGPWIRRPAACGGLRTRRVTRWSATTSTPPGSSVSPAARATSRTSPPSRPERPRRPLHGRRPTRAILGGCDAILICVPTPLDRRAGAGSDLRSRLRRDDRRGAPRGPARRPRVDDLSRDHPRGGAAAARAQRPRGRARGSSSPIRRSGSIPAAATIRSPAPRRSSAGSHPPASSGPSQLYAEVCDEVITVSSPEAAELSKLLENIFRSVNIALVNELAQLTDRLGIDIWEVVDAAASKPFGFMRFEPGPGMGGHCLPVDPFYLAFKARQHDFATEFVELAGKINQSHPLFCVGKIQRALNDREKSVKGSRVLIVGVAYKSGVADLREAPALKIIESPARARGRRSATTTRTCRRCPEQGLESVPLDAGRRGRRRGRDRHRPSRARLPEARRGGLAGRGLPRRHPRPRRRQRRPALTCSDAARIQLRALEGRLTRCSRPPPPPPRAR